MVKQAQESAAEMTSHITCQTVYRKTQLCQGEINSPFIRLV